MQTTEQTYMEAAEEYQGYCRHCDDITNGSGVEPDAENYQCERCGLHQVMGIEQALVMGYITFVGKEAE